VTWPATRTPGHGRSLRRSCNDIYGATLATVHLAVRDRREVLYVDRLAGSSSVPIVSTIGSRLPMHATVSAQPVARRTGVNSPEPTGDGATGTYRDKITFDAL
jgi:hypothetical protein